MPCSRPVFCSVYHHLSMYVTLEEFEPLCVIIEQKCLRRVSCLPVACPSVPHIGGFSNKFVDRYIDYKFLLTIA